MTQNGQSLKKGKVKKYGFLKFLIFTVVFLLSFLTYYHYSGGTYLQNVQFILPYSKITYTLPSDLNEEIAKKIGNELDKVSFENIKRFQKTENGDVLFKWKEEKGITNKYIVPVAHIYSIKDDFNSKTQKIYIDNSLDNEIKEILKIKFPEATISEDISKILDSNGKNVALISSENLTFKYKLLNLNGKYFLDNILGSFIFGLNIESPTEYVNEIVKANIPDLSAVDFNLSDVGKLNQTGVTAITRALAKKIESVGDYGYPGKAVSKFLKDADLTHVSNEISSVPGCVPTDGMRFCSKPEYLQTLKDIGVDIVELTGNHNNDYGATYNTQTINSYKKLGWEYFGGGLNSTDAAKILYIDSKGTKLAFIGYDYYDTMQGTGAIASKDRAGANSYSDKKMKANILEARQNADIVIVDFQFQECYSYPEHSGAYPICYKPLANPDQKGVFRKAVDYGADIVVGTQAHQPQTYEIYNGKMIYYGLGNLFFDQAYWLGTKHGLILTHYYKSGKLIQTKLTTTNYDINLQTYISKGSERELLLNLLKEAR